MQDLQTGELVSLDQERMRKYAENLMRAGMLQPDAVRDAIHVEGCRAIPDKARRGPVFTVGQKLRLGTGLFVVHSIGRKFLMLRGLPGTVANETVIVNENFGKEAQRGTEKGKGVSDDSEHADKAGTGLHRVPECEHGTVDPDSELSDRGDSPGPLRVL